MARLRRDLSRWQWAETAAVAAVFLLVFSAAALAASPKPVQHPIALPHGTAPFGRHYKAVCAPVPGGARCFALIVTTAPGQNAPAVVAAVPQGYGPVDLQSAYNLSSLSATRGIGQTVAIVDAYDDSTAESDLAAYRSTYGLSPCTTANDCFRKVDQNGGTSYPPSDAHWSEEISLDLDMVSAIAPNAKMMLVEGNSTSFSDLATATNEAANLGATQISNSYGGDEESGGAYAGSYGHAGVAVTASTGDNGYGCVRFWAPCFPASVPSVEAVGGTSLNSISPRTESAWGGAGSGCSTQFAKPSWQQDPDCSMRSVGDVSAVADPNTGVAVYASALGGWAILGGTSASAPIIASFDALIGLSASSPQWAYQHANAFDDVTTGSNDLPGSTCPGDYLCNAGPGYDGPTGVGTPNGAGVALAPTASTGGATNIGISTATITGTVNPNGSATSYRFDYGTTSGYGLSTAVGDAGSGTAGVAVSATLSGLRANTTYHYRVVALRGGSVAATGVDQTLTTRASATVELGASSTPLIAFLCPPSIPATRCTIIAVQVTALQTMTQGRNSPMIVSQAGRMVAVTLGLSALSRNPATAAGYVRNLNSKYGGPPQVALAVLRRVGALALQQWQVVAESRELAVRQWLGRVVRMTLPTPLSVRPGDAIALTTPTWAPVLAIGLPGSYQYRQSRSGNCNTVPHQAEIGLGQRARFSCQYAGTRVEYTATEVIP